MEDKKLTQLEAFANQLKEVEEERKKVAHERMSYKDSLSHDIADIAFKRKELSKIETIEKKLAKGQYTRRSDFTFGDEKRMVEKLGIRVPPVLSLTGNEEGCLKILLGFFAFIWLVIGIIPMVISRYDNVNIITSIIYGIAVLACGIIYYNWVNKKKPAIQNERNQFYSEFHTKLASYKKSLEIEINESMNKITELNEVYEKDIDSKFAEVKQKEQEINSQIYGTILPNTKVATETGLTQVFFTSYELYEIIAMVHNGEVKSLEEATTIELDRKEERAERARKEAMRELREKIREAEERDREAEQIRKENWERYEAEERAKKAEYEASKEKQRLEREKRNAFYQKEAAKRKYSSALNSLANAESNYAHIAAHPENFSRGALEAAAKDVARLRAEAEKAKADIW